MKKTKTVIKLWSDNFNGELVSHEAYKEIKLRMSTGDFGTHRRKVVPRPKRKPVMELDEILIQDLAEATSTSHDGGINDNRLFVDDFQISIFANDMSKKEYALMEKDINSFEIKGAGFVVYAWNDCSGYEYWKKEGEADSANYIQITVAVEGIRKINVDKLKRAIELAKSKFQKYDNLYEHEFNKRNAAPERKQA